MVKAAGATFEPRKTPVQRRSGESVDAILEATIQVLLSVGKEQLTTTRVAQRAGVSVGTLYQYFPNKTALLRECLVRHMDGVRNSVGKMCEEHKGAGLLEMGTTLVFAYLGAKMRDPKESAALYSVSSDIEGAALSHAASERARSMVAEMFATAKEGLTKDPETVATMVLASLNGVARRLLEIKSPERHLEPMREELLALVHAYLRTCAASPLE
ncbi:MAG TPA: TetR/AcrR family transcriptional regulator [Edaphobacter sp.]